MDTNLNHIPSMTFLAYFSGPLVQNPCLFLQVSQDVGYQIFATMATFYVPLVLILLLYWRIFVTARNRLRNRLAQKAAIPSAKIKIGESGMKANQAVKSVTAAQINKKNQVKMFSNSNNVAKRTFPYAARGRFHQHCTRNFNARSSQKH